MAVDKRNTYLDASLSDESDDDAGYDSEAAEISKAGRASKRRKIEHDHTDEEEDDVDAEQPFSKPEEPTTEPTPTTGTVEEEQQLQDESRDGIVEDTTAETDNASFDPTAPSHSPSRPAPPILRKKKAKDKIERTPGVVYLSSLPPYLKPSALRNILEQRGFAPIARIFLSPASKSNKTHSSGGKNSRQLYTEGWIEFSSKQTAKRCAETLNASTVGGKKGGYYRDDVWNMKYLSGMRWEELMAGVREEKREMEGRRDEERRVIARETKVFVEGVEEGRKRDGMKRKREKKKDIDAQEDGRPAGQTEDDVRRTWRQNEVRGKTKPKASGTAKMSDDVKQVLGKIF